MEGSPGRSIVVLLAIAVAAGSAGLAVADRGDGPGEAAVSVPARAALANACAAIAVGDGGFIAARGSEYRADARRSRATAFHLKPTGPRTYLLHDDGAMLLAASPAGDIFRTTDPGAAAEWRVRRVAEGAFTLTSTAEGRALALAPDGNTLVVAPTGARLAFYAARGCRRFPEAAVNARGKGVRGTNPDGTVFGYADTHVHVSANLRAGGQVISGEPFHRFGIGEALGRDGHVHGPDGSLDTVGNLLRDGVPVGTHDTHGWPTFEGWPVHDTYTHQQVYYRWLKRAWKGGLRLIVAQAVEDEALCELVPQRSHSCDETETVKLAIRQLRDLERYVDAQAGGRGRGWFRIVTNPGSARRVIEAGKLAVVIGMETSSPLGCAEFQGAPQCTREDIDRVLAELHRLGVRSLFVAHWVDNAFSGAALQSGAQGTFIGTFQSSTTGHPFATEPCGEADEAEGQCNSKGLTELGAYLYERMMAKHMLIEADHLSQRARERTFELAERRGYPLVSSHTGTGGEWTPEQLRRLYALGGIASATPEQAPELTRKILRFRRARDSGRYFGVALGTDTGGFNALPGPRADAAEDPLEYPFRAYGSDVRFSRQRTGTRTFDVNRDGVAHYGLFPDLLADVGRQPRGGRALRYVFRSAEAYLQMWEQTYRR